MLPQRETMTDSLADLIQILHLGGNNGILTVERSIGTIVEDGYILFSSGRVIEARVGQVTGLTAFHYLNTWQACRFSFTTETEGAPQSSFPKSGPLSTSTGNLANGRATHPGRQNAASNTYDEGTVAPSPFPIRLLQGEAALQHPETAPLSRTHRRLLLLINGQRSVSELARLLTRSFEEMQALLDDLERADLIQQ
jgi:hypothetical protein